MQPSRETVPHVPDYELVRLIGRGSYGDVWLARSVTGAFRAIKFVWRDRFADLRPYEREFEGITRFTAVSLREPSQLALLHVGRDEAATFFYYVMELADDAAHGRDIVAAEYVPLTLSEVRRQRGRVPPGEVIAIGVALARALASLHVAGLVHRDIKPSNIVFVGGVPKLADVGLVAAASAGLTFVGTEGYVPPEGPGAPAADVFGLGKVLYELATGLDRTNYPRLPPDFDAMPDRKELLELNEVVIRACEPDARKRFTDAAALLDELLLLQAGKSVRRLRNAERRTTRALRIAAALALIATVAGAGAWIEQQRANKELALREKAEAERDALARREVYSAALTQAQRALEQDEYGRARKFLQSAVPKPGETDLRGFEWHALWNDAKGDVATILRSSGTAGQRVRCSTEGNLIAAQMQNGEAILWDANSKRERGRITGIHQLTGFSEDASWVYGSANGKIRRWQTNNGKIDDKTGFNATWPLGPTGRDRWISIRYEGLGMPFFLQCDDFATGKEVWSQKVPTQGAQGIGDYYTATLASDGERCAMAFNYRRNQVVTWKIVVFSLPDMNIVWGEDNIVHRPSVLSFGPHGDSLICVWDDEGKVNLLDLREKKWRWSTQMPMNRFTTLAHDGDHLLAVGGRSGRINLVDVATGKIVGERRGHESDVQDAVFLEEGRLLLSTGDGGDVRLWSLGDESARSEFPGFWNPGGGGREVRVANDGRWFAATAPLATTLDGAIQGACTRIIQPGATTKIAEILDAVAPISVSNDGNELWVISSNGRLETRGINEPDKITSSMALPLLPTIVAASSDCRVLACFDAKGGLVFVDSMRHHASAKLDSGHGYPYWIALSSDGRLAASSGRDLTVRLWDVHDNKLISSWKMTDQIVNGAISPDGRIVALLHLNGMVEGREVAGHVEPVRLVTSSGILHAIAFHPTEPRLFLGGQNGTMHVVDTNTWRVITQLRAVLADQKPCTIERAAMSADGSLLLAYTESGTLRLWRRNADKR